MFYYTGLKEELKGETDINVILRCPPRRIPMELDVTDGLPAGEAGILREPYTLRMTI